LPAWNYILRGGWILDGTGSDALVGDVAIEDELLDAVGELPESATDSPSAMKVLDCSGLAVAPGFIDVHTHSDLSLLAGPQADTHVAQGVTTNVCGNCGNSSFPAGGARAERLAEQAAHYGVKVDWTGLPGYLKQIEKTPSTINRALLVGHGSVRASVLGYANRQPNQEELEAMRAEVRKAMELGCLGLSSGLIYPPGMYTETGELLELAKVAAKAGGIYASHIRNEGDHLEESLKEFLAIGKQARIPLQLSHVKIHGQHNWHKIDHLIDTVEQARSKGLKITADRYPYTASETSLDVLLPQWAFEGGHAREMKRLTEKNTRNRLEKEIAEAHPDGEFWKLVVVGSVREKSLRNLQGRSIDEIAADLKKPPIKAFLDILVEDEAATQAMYHTMSEEHLERLLQLPWVMVGSDSSARAAKGPSSGGHPHPRGCGSFARVLSRYVRKKKTLTLAAAVHKMTGLPAETFNLSRRGVLAEGNFADVVVFDPEKISDQATYRSPKKLAEGIHHVFVNGRPVMLSGKRTEELPGRLLRRESTR
jgi:N-acyl-D-aspartate/D-glutamate deacylase